MCLFPVFYYGCGDEEEKAGIIDEGKQLLEKGEFKGAKEKFQKALGKEEKSCDARYGLMISETMVMVEDINEYLLPVLCSAMSGDFSVLIESFTELLGFPDLLEEVDNSIVLVEEMECGFWLDRMPFLFGFPDAPYLEGEIRGEWTVRNAYFIGSLVDVIQYMMDLILEGGIGFLSEARKLQGFSLSSYLSPALVGELPTLPPELESHLKRRRKYYNHLFSAPANPPHRGGWLDTDGDGVPSPDNRLLIDIFVPGADERVIDLSDAEMLIP